MRKTIILLLILLAMVVLTAFTPTGYHQGLSIKMGTKTNAGITDHRLFIDGATHNYLLIDGANHYLRIDGA